MKKQAEYDARYLAKCAKEGIVRVSVKVPADRAEDLKAIAKGMRQQRSRSRKYNCRTGRSLK